MAIYDYSKIDPIIKANPDISWKKFQATCPIKISNWSFNARKFALKGVSGYGTENQKPIPPLSGLLSLRKIKSKVDKIPAINNMPTSNMSVDEIINKLRPNAVKKRIIGIL